MPGEDRSLISLCACKHKRVVSARLQWCVSLSAEASQSPRTAPSFSRPAPLLATAILEKLWLLLKADVLPPTLFLASLSEIRATTSSQEWEVSMSGFLHGVHNLFPYPSWSKPSLQCTPLNSRHREEQSSSHLGRWAPMPAWTGSNWFVAYVYPLISTQIHSLGAGW